ncbi:MAG: serpin family protein [Chloroflexaceae bacterium]|nr:serpin family protein [Chloroflexaceae bacterium]
MMVYRSRSSKTTTWVVLTVWIIGIVFPLLVAGCGGSPSQGQENQQAPPQPPPQTQTPAMGNETTRPEPVVSVAFSERPRQTAPGVAPATLDALVAGNTAFAFDLYQVLRQQDGNLFYSPYSISAALAMTYAGARGPTANQMETTLHFSLPAEQVHAAFNALDLSLTSSNGNGSSAEDDQEPPTLPPEGSTTGQEEAGGGEFQLHTANSLWGQHGHPFLPAFLDLLSQHYGAGLRLVDFQQQPEAARLAINEWVSEQTQAKIEQLIPEGAIDRMTRLVLANAIYFKADWEHPFEAEDTYEDSFFLLNDETVMVDMMTQQEELRYAEGEGYQMVGLPYTGDAELVAFVPEKGRFGEVEARLNGALVQQATENLVPRQVDLTIPKFRFALSSKLKPLLAELGMTEAFSPEADFRGWTAAGG